MIEQDPKFCVITQDLPLSNLNEGDIMEIRLKFKFGGLKYYLLTNGETEFIRCKCNSKIKLYTTKKFWVERRFAERLKP